MTYIFAFGCQHHEGYAEHCVGTGGEDGELHIAVLHAELHFGTLRASYPVALCFLQRVGPVYLVKTVKQTLCVCRHSQTPLLHLLLYHGIAAALTHAVHHLVIGEHCAKSGTPVHHCLAKVGYTVVHQHLLLLLLAHLIPLLGGEVQLLAHCHVQVVGAFMLKMLYELFYGQCL